MVKTAWADGREKLVRRMLVIVLIVVFLAWISIGRYAVSPLDVLKILIQEAARALESIWGGRYLGDYFTAHWGEQNEILVNVVIQVRLPRIIMATLVGAGLSAAGTAYQSVFANPLVSPDILGVSSGSGFGAALAILLLGTAHTFGIQSIALVFGIGAVFLVFLISRIQRKTELFMLVLSGVIVRSLFDALVAVIKYTADTNNKLPAITVWLMGSLASSSYKNILIALCTILPCVFILYLLRWKMNILSLDEEEAKSLGINVTRLRGGVIFLSTLITGVSVSLCGIISWIGLVIPHICRLLTGNDHRHLLPASCLVGSIYLLCIDGIARSVTAAEIPLSILTSIVGAPLFAWILRKTAGAAK